jgi:hypothetical protein
MGAVLGKPPRKNGDDLTAKHQVALRANISALQAHTKAIRTSVALSMGLNRIGVRKILAKIWSVPSYIDVDEKEPLSDYITGGPQAIMDFADTLNANIPGLQLSPGNLKGVKNVSTLINVILKHLK